MRLQQPGQVAATICLLALGACSEPDVSGDWPDYDGPAADHHSPLAEIDARNVQKLGLAWHYDIDAAPSSLTAPIAVDGRLYFAGGLSVVHALDAVTGKLLWRHDPEVGRAAGTKLRAAWGSRGIAHAGGRLFVGTIDGRLIGLDARTGQPIWSVPTTEPGDGRYISGAPWVFNDKVIIGHGGGDFAPVRGYVTAYDQATGKLVWRFHTVPGDPAKGFENAAMRMAAKTWRGEWWRHGGGGTVWNAFAYDPRTNRIYIGTGNGTPWNQKIRSPGGGDNLFVCSIIALDADSGNYIWHYQTNPGETWDYNSAMDIILADMPIDGKLRPVILHAPKNGFFYVIDRETGKLISAKPIVSVNWAESIDSATGRPIERPEARFPDGRAAIVYPSPFGAHNIEAMSYNPATRLAYVPAMDQGRVYVDPPDLSAFEFKSGMRISNGIGAPPPGLKPHPPSSMLIAWDPLRQREMWRIPMRGLRGGGSTMSTAGGLLFQGRGTGQFTALNAVSGRQLWSFEAQTAVMAQPISYRAGGRQQVSVIAGARFPTAQGLEREWDYRIQQWRLLTFRLGATAALPAQTAVAQPVPQDPAFALDPENVAQGSALFADRCAICHGAAARSGGAAPDLRRSPIAFDAAAFRTVLAEGPLVARGMPQFAELTDTEVAALREFIRSAAREARADGNDIEAKGQADAIR